MIAKLETANIWSAQTTHADADPSSKLWASFVGADISRCVADGYPVYTASLFNRARQRCKYITMDRSVLNGQPRIVGTRIPVRAIVRTLEHYGSIDRVVECYPHLTKEQITDALYFVQNVLELPSGLSEPAPTAR